MPSQGLQHLDVTKEVPSFKLPANIWGAVIFAGFSAPSMVSQVSVHFLAALLPGLCGCVAIQVMFIYYIAMLVDTSDAVCEQGSPILRTLCLAVLAWFMIAKDFEETFQIVFFMRQFPAYDKDRDDAMLKEKGAGFLYKELPDFDVAVPMTGLTGFQRGSVYMLMAAKLLCGLALHYFAAGYVARSTSDENMILNSVAMLFVIEIDEIMYAVIVPDFMRRLVDKMPNFVADPDTWWSDDNVSQEVAAVFKMLVRWWTGVATCAAMYLSWCSLPGVDEGVLHVINLGIWAGFLAGVTCCLIPCLTMCCTCFQWCFGSLGEEGDIKDLSNENMKEKIKAALNSDVPPTSELTSETA